MGNRTVIEDGHNGLLFPRGNGEALCARLEQVLGSPELRERLGKAARKTVVERFELGKLLMAETTLLREVAASHRPWGGG
jgi:glycosyltransferase involved in cell wall biosynthesis